MISQDFQKQVKGYGLTTAHILYRRPDHPWLLQTYVWQAYDLCPEFPELQGFLEFWQKSLEGVLHSVRQAFWRCGGGDGKKYRHIVGRYRECGVQYLAHQCLAAFPGS